MIKVFGDHKGEFFYLPAGFVSRFPGDLLPGPRAALARSLRADLASIPLGRLFQASVRGWRALHCPTGIFSGDRGVVENFLIMCASGTPSVIPQSIPRKWHVDLTLHHASETPGANGLLALGSVAVDCQTESLLGKCTE